VVRVNRSCKRFPRAELKIKSHCRPVPILLLFLIMRLSSFLSELMKEADIRYYDHDPITESNKKLRMLVSFNLNLKIIRSFEL